MHTNWIVQSPDRSRIMRAVLPKGNKTTEAAVKRLLRQQKISGWRTHMKTLDGKPDFAFMAQRLAIFIDGCFWHQCSSCARKRNLQPRNNKSLWEEKFRLNILRDRVVNRSLRAKGWTVIRIWEHRLRLNPSKVVEQIKGALN